MYPLQWEGGSAFGELEASSALSGEEHGDGFPVCAVGSGRGRGTVPLLSRQQDKVNLAITPSN